MDYFQTIFTSSGHQEQVGFLDNLQACVTEGMNEVLMQQYSAEEVVQALNQMEPSKAPGPDGMPPLFYQKYWTVVGKDVTEAVLKVLNEGVFPAELNHTHIALIPKKDKPETVAEYRPISLCNVAYKLISKVLSNRLKQVLPQVISLSQSAFVPGRLITDNVLVAYELVHYLRQKRKGKKGYMSLKLDMSKAYDRVEWGFLDNIMGKMGFNERWRKLVMCCVQIVTYSIIVNGSPKGPIKPSRGLRQGDPLSPYLFLLCTEGLIAMLRQAEENKRVEGVKICRDSPRINNLLFADDSLFFCRATLQTNADIHQLLKEYELASGQKVNKEKTAMVLSTNVNPQLQQEIMASWGIQQAQKYEKYLGLPSVVGRSKKSAFANIKSRVWKKLQGWKERLLSQGGKEVLIKAVALSIPSYSMSCFKLPESLCKELENMMAKFWWGQRREENKIRWVSWTKMCAPKQDGGMGFKDLHSFNMALLAKQAWRIMNEKSSLLHRIYKSKYFPNSCIQYAQLGNAPSYAWRGIWESTRLMVKGCRWRVGDGESINIWTDIWLPGQNQTPLGLYQESRSSCQRVAQLIDGETGWWEIEIVRRTLPPREASDVLRIPLGPSPREDKLIWHYENSGEYTVRSAYRLFWSIKNHRVEGGCSNYQALRGFWKQLWSMPIPHRVRVFSWRACKHGLPTLQNLRVKKVVSEDTCKFCHEGREDTSHALIYCPSILPLWKSLFGFLFRGGNQQGFMEIAMRVTKEGQPRDLEKFFLMAWSFWYRRNLFYFEEQVQHPQQSVDHAMSLFKESREAQASTKQNMGCCTSSVGVILRDEKGKVILAVCKKEPEFSDPMEVELLAILRGLQLCIPLGIGELIVETDSMLSVRALTAEGESMSPHGNLIYSILSLSKQLPKVTFQHAGRVHNAAADGLAKLARFVEDLTVWWELIPECISQIVWHEASL
ncbi:uncharacterized protein LOC122278535 [Carya illinoinensis]|uniref:uncharacterized protein LOC122278535 n=1 Tax=Carya illinoinensis TaxID=32201 RepID=UPI001C71DA01|nr:uncharacterized protein LOC122278535 [Carya illinoinensis]